MHRVLSIEEGEQLVQDINYVTRVLGINIICEMYKYLGTSDWSLRIRGGIIYFNSEYNINFSDKAEDWCTLSALLLDEEND